MGSGVCWCGRPCCAVWPFQKILTLKNVQVRSMRRLGAIGGRACVCVWGGGGGGATGVAVPPGAGPMGAAGGCSLRGLTGGPHPSERPNTRGRAGGGGWGKVS